MTIPTLQKMKLRSGKAKLLSGLEEVAQLVFSFHSDFVAHVVPTVPSVQAFGFHRAEIFPNQWGEEGDLHKVTSYTFCLRIYIWLFKNTTTD